MITTLLAQAAPATWTTWDGTVLGLLTLVLSAVGYGVYWFTNRTLDTFRAEQESTRELLHTQLETFKSEQDAARTLFKTEQAEMRKAFESAIEGARSVWMAQLNREQERSERVISNISDDFRSAVSEFKALVCTRQECQDRLVSVQPKRKPGREA